MTRLRGPGALSLAVALLAIVAAPAIAGGGPETVLVVVNADSPLSLAVANEYVRLRDIPATHVCLVHDVPNLTVIGVDVFRDRLWAQVEAFLAENALEQEIDVVAWSADFPYGVDYDADFAGETLGQGVHEFRVASLTGMTFLIDLVKAKSRTYLGLRGEANRYFRREPGNLLPGHGFCRAYRWDGGAEPLEGDGDGEGEGSRYLLSTMLGVTGLQGNTLPEVLDCLGRAATSDGTRPDGAVYLMENGDVRAKTRMPQFEPTRRALEALGRRCVVLAQGEDGQDGRVPVGRDDVLGCVAGIASFDWEKSKSTLLPGSIAEHLTSFGAMFNGSGQTKISAFIRAGAAGSSGAVAEPYSIWTKFPTASLHVHYAAGCSLAESFFQSVAAPYQLLVVGDPLARPFARFAKVALEAPAPEAPWRGVVAVRVRIEPAEGTRTRTTELWVDGQRLATGPPDAPLDLDTTTLADGPHDVRIIAIEERPVETRSFARATVVVDNGVGSVTLKGPRRGAGHGEVVKFSGRATGAERVDLRAGARLLAKAHLRGGVWRAEIDTRALGWGRVAIHAWAAFEGGREAVSPAFGLEVRAPEPARAKRRSKGGQAGGLVATVKDAKGEEHEFPVPAVGPARGNRFAQLLREKVGTGVREVILRGSLQAPGTGPCRLAINAAGDLEVKVGGETVFDAEGLVFDRQRHAAFALRQGRTEIEVTYVPSGDGDLVLWLGGTGVTAPM